MRQQGNSQSGASQPGGSSGEKQVSVRRCRLGASAAGVLAARKGMAMETETLGVPRPKVAKKKSRNVRGVFEKAPASDISRVRFICAKGRFRRPNAGTKRTAIALYRKRQVAALEG